MCSNPARCAELFPKAENGDANAQFELGNLYSFGNFSGYEYEASQKEAAKWYFKAADQGHDKALNRIADDSSQDHELTPDYKFIRWEQKANEGHVVAMMHVGLAYKSGRGVKQDASSDQMVLKGRQSGLRSSSTSAFRDVLQRRRSWSRLEGGR